MKYKDLSKQELEAVDLIVEWARRIERYIPLEMVEASVCQLIKDIQKELNG
jgi:hypothetical protein